MSNSAWKAVGRVSVVALIAAVAAAVLQLPGAEMLTPWLGLGGIAGLVATGIVLGSRSRRNAKAQYQAAEQQAARAHRRMDAGSGR